MSSGRHAPEVSSRSDAAQESKANWRLEDHPDPWTGGSSSGSGACIPAAAGQRSESCCLPWGAVPLQRETPPSRTDRWQDGVQGRPGAAPARWDGCKAVRGHGCRSGRGGRCGLALVERAPPPMSSSAVQGRSLITSSRLSAKRPSSPSSNACFACLAPEAVPPRPLRDALLDPILFHPFEMLAFIDYMELTLRPTLGFAHSRTRAQKGEGCRRADYLSPAAPWPH